MMTMSPSPSSNPTANNSSVSFVLIGIAIIVSIAVVVIYFLFSKNKNRKMVTSSESKSLTINRQPTIGSKIDAGEKISRPFDVFLCYKKSSGKDYADHLKSGLEELGLHTFEDCKDIPLTVNTEEGWACDRDKAFWRKAGILFLS